LFCLKSFAKWQKFLKFGLEKKIQMIQLFHFRPVDIIINLWIFVKGKGFFYIFQAWHFNLVNSGANSKEILSALFRFLKIHNFGYIDMG